MSATEKILIVDDDSQQRMNLRVLLEDLGFQILEAPSGTEALEICSRERPDLVLLDIRMPGMDGFEVCSRMRTDEELSMIPVLFLSGALEALDKVKAFQSGGVDFITKPYRFEEVVARVQTHLEIVHQRQRLQQQNAELQRSLEETKLMNLRFIEINERLRKSEELRGQFLSNMRSEVNNPLNAILAFGVELERGEVPPERGRVVGGLIATEASALDFEFRNVCCAAELEAGEAIPSVHSVDVASVLRDALDSLRFQAREKSTRMILEADGLVFRTDADKLRLIAANLVSNGIKFSPEGGTVQVRARVQEGQLWLEVEDHGPGIRPEDQDLIFERFRQLESGTLRSHRGQGLGLSVVKALVDLLNGAISICSELDKGSTFICTLPEGSPLGNTVASALDGNLFFFGDAEEA